MVNGNTVPADDFTAMTCADTTDDSELSYSYRPSLLGAPWELRLTLTGIVWSAGARSGVVPYARIARLRMAYRPISMQTTRFVTEIWAFGEPPLRIVSVSWKSMVEQERLDAAYAHFVRELHARIAAAGVQPVCERGRPALIYWPGLAVFIGVSLGLAALIVRTLEANALLLAVFVGAFFAVFVWHGGTFFSRNRPGHYAVGEPPRDLLPG